MTTTRTEARPRAGTVRDVYGVPLPAPVVSYPVQATCDSCRRVIFDPDGSGVWFHRRPRRGACG